MKMILAGGKASIGDLSRFRTEAEAVARMQHPNIVQIYEVGDHVGQPYFSLEFVNGGTLADLIQNNPLNDHWNVACKTWHAQVILRLA